MEISITRSLNELKLLEARINRAITEGTYVALQIGNNKINGHMSVEDFNKSAEAYDKKVKDLIRRRSAIKAAIVESNAVTTVSVSNEEMTVAQAIDEKNAIGYKKSYLHQLRSQYTLALRKLESENETVKVRLDKHLETSLGKDAKGKEDQVTLLTNSFNELNRAKLVDPLNLKAQIEALQEHIEGFESEVDFILSESNTRTLITIPDN